jgi:hypothetical protein
MNHITYVSIHIHVCLSECMLYTRLLYHFAAPVGCHAVSSDLDPDNGFRVIMYAAVRGAIVYRDPAV